jgi:pyrroline-5-carboxylate reductase
MFFFNALLVRLLLLKRNDLRLIGAQVRDSCGSSGTGETPQAFTPRRLTARPAESEHLEGKSTTPHYLVNIYKVCENRSDFVEQFIAFAAAHFLTLCKLCYGFICFK